MRARQSDFFKLRRIKLVDWNDQDADLERLEQSAQRAKPHQPRAVEQLIRIAGGEPAARLDVEVGQP